MGPGIRTRTTSRSTCRPRAIRRRSSPRTSRDVPFPLEHGAPLRLLAPMKLGLKNIKAITSIAYSAEEPADYWNERGYSKYDGL